MPQRLTPTISQELYNLVGNVVSAVKFGNVNYFYKGKLICEDAQTDRYKIEEQDESGHSRFFCFGVDDVKYTVGPRLVFKSNISQFH